MAEDQLRPTLRTLKTKAAIIVDNIWRASIGAFSLCEQHELSACRRFSCQQTDLRQALNRRQQYTEIKFLKRL